MATETLEMPAPEAKPKRKRAPRKPAEKPPEPTRRTRARSGNPTVYRVFILDEKSMTWATVGDIEVPPNTKRAKVRDRAGEFTAGLTNVEGPRELLVVPVKDVDTFKIQARTMTMIDVVSS